MNWGYKTTPQEHCNGRELLFHRGKGLGGSTAINFGLYTVGARDDYDQWAAEVGNDTFAWTNMLPRFKALETFSGEIARPEHQKYVAPQAADHGDKGALRVGYVKEWEADLSPILDALKEAGLEQNLDHNSGNPLGLSVSITSVSDGMRSTAADLLNDASETLVILPDSPVQRIILEGKKAVGVQSNGTQCKSLFHCRHLLSAQTATSNINSPDFASKEVIISAGSLDSPKILMHSGIGPAAELTKFNIPVIHDLPAIGQGLKDHPCTPFLVARNPETNDRNAFYGNPEAMAAGMKQWEKDGTGPWTRYGGQIANGWFKSDRITASEEFKALPDQVQDFMNRETIPHYELICGVPVHLSVPQMFQDYSYKGLAVFLMNQQSIGEVRLQSSDPDVPLLFDPHFLEHPFDRRACIEMYKHLLELTDHPAFAKDTIATLMQPASRSDEDILQFVKNNVSSTFHMTGTVKMGKEGDESAAVDTSFRVFGIENLRVADMSVVPVLTNNHTQATAYVTGATCADVLIRDYGLDQ
jgi:choline dehydrogenase-like flavoprotein